MLIIVGIDSAIKGKNMFDDIRTLSRHFLSIKNSPYKRYLVQSVDFTNRMSFIVGQRGVGKTTALVQILLSKVHGDSLDSRILYIQADHFQLAGMNLYELAEQFTTLGGKWIAFDEIHKYSNWSAELKSIYDTFPDLQVFASGSSALEIHKGSHDLSRRAIRYPMYGMSFREYLELSHKMSMPAQTLEVLCQNHERLSQNIVQELQKKDLKVIPLFQQYLKTGYYPFFIELNNEALFQLTLEQNIHTTIESDIATIFPQLTGSSLRKIKNLLIFIAGAVPFTPNWKKMMGVLEIGDERTLKAYFKLLDDAGLIRVLFKPLKKLNALESPEKVYLNNTNQIYAIAPAKSTEKGTIRETFFLSMIPEKHTVAFPEHGDFLVDESLLFEIGGKNKSFHQIQTAANGYVVCDDIELGSGRKIPLWLFGFLY